MTREKVDSDQGWFSLSKGEQTKKQHFNQLVVVESKCRKTNDPGWLGTERKSTEQTTFTRITLLTLTPTSSLS
jgi:hypothetical protein